MLKKGVTKGFTLAEVLITLGIIGIVAALTIPNLIARNEERVRESQLKKAYSVLAQVHQMMIVQDVYPYKEFVAPFKDQAEEGDESDGSGESGGSENPDVPPTNPTDPVDPPTEPTEPTEPGDSGSDPSKPDINDHRTKELVDGIIEGFKNGDWGTIIGNVRELYNMYGLFNLEQFIKDYIEQTEDSKASVELDNKLATKFLYRSMLSALSESESNDLAMMNFVSIKKLQLATLKGLLSGAEYCPSYDKCYGPEPITYTTLNGTAARIEAAEFENSALKTAEGMYIWLGDMNNPQRYYVDINGSKRPNKLGVDVFTFDIISKEAITPERSGNCTLTGTPTDGEAYRGLGCTGYALVDEVPDVGGTGYWKKVK